MKQKNTQKLNVLKRMLGKRVAVITNYSTLDHFYGEVIEIFDETNVVVKNDKNEASKASIFDIRNPSQEL
jgi:ferredoxin-fold anticodon binding domain-containing protein